MSMHTTSDSGYGVNLNSLKLKKGRALWTGLMEILDGTKIKSEFLDKLDEDGHERNWKEVADMMGYDYNCIRNNGLGFLIAAAINEKENLDLEALDEDSCGCEHLIVVTPHYPFKQIPKHLLKSEDEYAALFRKYLSHISEGKDILVDYVSTTYCA